MSPDTIHKRRLLRLARHLLHGTLARSNFNFQTWNSNATKRNACGTEGCAIGECPFVFPKTFRWDFNDVVSKQGWSSIDFICDQSGIDFFGLTYAEASSLFLPKMCSYTARLPSTATRYDVAKNIISFVKKKYGKIRLTKEDTAQLALATLC